MIKEVNREDIDLIKLLEESFKDYFKNKGIKEDFDNNIFSKYFIYLEKCNIIGFVNYYDLYDRFEISYIEVKEEYRNKKIGSELIENVINIGKNKNITNITLEVNINNENAIKLYSKYDFKVVAVRPRYYNGTDGYLMERKMI
jgi:ribosomal-protein-alanine N-acetyltransferase